MLELESKVPCLITEHSESSKCSNPDCSIRHLTPRPLGHLLSRVIAKTLDSTYFNFL